jgi:hypothetical protein
MNPGKVDNIWNENDDLCRPIYFADDKAPKKRK